MERRFPQPVPKHKINMGKNIKKNEKHKQNATTAPRQKKSRKNVNEKKYNIKIN